MAKGLFGEERATQHFNELYHLTIGLKLLFLSYND